MTFDHEWRRCAPWLEAALAHSGDLYGIADVRGMIEAGEAQFWPGRRAAMVTQITEYPRATVLQLWLAGGDIEELTTELRPKAEIWGAGRGCDRALILGRAGWARALRGHGYEARARLVMKELRP